MRNKHTNIYLHFHKSIGECVLNMGWESFIDNVPVCEENKYTVQSLWNKVAKSSSGNIFDHARRILSKR